MKLYLVQHGEARARDVDPERPLTERGRADVERLAGFLARAGIRVTRVIHSGKRRAEQTATCLAGAVAPGLMAEAVDFLEPDGAPSAHDWDAEGGKGDLLVVGHLPYLGRLVSQRVIGDPAKPVVAFRPGSILCLELAEGEGWRVAWMIRPELLPA